MIVGLTDKEREEREKKRREPRKIFSFRPRKLEDGRVAFFEIIEREEVSYKAYSLYCDYSTYRTVYREPGTKTE